MKTWNISLTSAWRRSLDIMREKIYSVTLILYAPPSLRALASSPEHITKLARSILESTSV